MANKSAPVKYVVNNELTPDAILYTELLKSCSFNIGAPSAVQIGGDSKKTLPKMQYWQRFVDITYPDGEKSSAMTIPNCVMHHKLHEHFGKSSIFVGIPKSFVNHFKLRASSLGHNPIMEDKRILSDDHYWWTRASNAPAQVNEEYIRVIEIVNGEPEETAYGSFTDLFADFPASVIANITCTLKLKAETELGKPLTGKEEWRAAIIPSMFTPIDVIDIPPPTTTSIQKSAYGKNDHARAGLMKIKRTT